VRDLHPEHGSSSRRCLLVRATAAAAAGHAGGQLAVLGEKAVGADVEVWWPLDQAWSTRRVVRDGRQPGRATSSTVQCYRMLHSACSTHVIHKMLGQAPGTACWFRRLLPVGNPIRQGGFIMIMKLVACSSPEKHYLVFALMSSCGRSRALTRCASGTPSTTKMETWRLYLSG